MSDVKWFSVLDKEPPEDTAVLLFDKFWGVQIGARMGKQFFSSDKDVCNYPLCVTHWAEIPSIPNAQEFAWVPFRSKNGEGGFLYRFRCCVCHAEIAAKVGFQPPVCCPNCGTNLYD